MTSRTGSTPATGPRCPPAWTPARPAPRRAVAAAPQPVEPLAEAERAYFPSQFPAPHGEIEPLPEQF